MSLSDCAIISTPCRERAQIACGSGYRIVGVVRERLTPPRVTARGDRARLALVTLKYRDIVGRHDAPGTRTSGRRRPIRVKYR
jgi:hypothetical protein